MEINCPSSCTQTAFNFGDLRLILVASSEATTNLTKNERKPGLILLQERDGSFHVGCSVNEISMIHECSLEIVSCVFYTIGKKHFIAEPRLSRLNNIHRLARREDYSQVMRDSLEVV